MKEPLNSGRRPEVSVHVAESAARHKSGMVRCEIGREVNFSPDRLSSYFLSSWKPEVFDALLVAAGVEFADRTLRRATHSWARSIRLHVPVHDVSRWEHPSVANSLRDALEYLTGDSWELSFYPRKRAATMPSQTSLELPVDVQAVIPFSNGLDSRAVSGLMARELGSRLVRVRLSTRLQDNERLRQHTPFTNVPYAVKGDSVESSARSRGFKFSVVSGVAAYLSGASQVVVPESGQGALGPALVPVGQTYEDYRSHPTFTRRMQQFLKELFDRDIEFVFPHIWHTKGETLRLFIEQCNDPFWANTRSCWQKRFVSFDGVQRQCGICAACMLRRMSIHSAGGAEPKEQYVWERLDASSLEQGAATGYPQERAPKAMREYAIAGTLHLDHLAALSKRPGGQVMLDVSSFHLAQALGMGRDAVRTKLDRMLMQHSHEWSAFLLSLGKDSFIRRWATEVQE